MNLTLPPDSPLDQLIHHSDPEVLIAVAGDARLSEDLALALLERRELVGERPRLLARQRRRLVDDAAGEDRHRHDVLAVGGAGYERGQKRRRSEDRAHRRLVVSATPVSGSSNV